MIVEIADFKVDPAKHKEFGDAIRQATDTVLSKASGYLGHTIFACIETPGRYVLTVQWKALDDHTIGFRQSAAFTDWRAIIGPYFLQAPHVEHFTVEGGGNKK